MNEASAWRAALARKIAPTYAANANVAAVILGGSVSRGWADRYSDIEIGVFWQQPPTDDERRAAIEQNSGWLWRFFPFDPESQSWSEDHYIGGVKIDPVHLTVATMEGYLAAVVDRAEADEWPQNVIAAVQHAIPMHGAALIAGWQEQAVNYPLALAEKMVEANLQVYPWYVTRMYAERGALHMVAAALNRASEQLFGILLGLNRIYHPGPKWLNQLEPEFVIAPVDYATRLQAAFRLPPVEGAALFPPLVEETFDLVDRHLPSVSTAWAREWFAWQRPVFDGPPDGLLLPSPPTPRPPPGEGSHPKVPPYLHLKSDGKTCSGVLQCPRSVRQDAATL